MKGLVSDTNLTAIGNAIREKTGKIDKIKVSSMAEEILSINTRPTFLINKSGSSNKPVWKVISSTTEPTDADVWAKGE